MFHSAFRLIPLLLFGAAFALSAANSLNDLRGLKTRESRFPLFNRGRLVAMVFSSETERNGNLIVSSGPVLDIIRRDADIDAIDTDGATRPYALKAPLADVFNFWRKRIAYSDGVILSSRADIDVDNRRAGSGEPVFFRSPLIDIDGIGFDFDGGGLDDDKGKRTLLVKRDVKIVLRLNSADPRTLLKNNGKLPDQYEFLTASADSLFIDFNRDEILLLGNIRIDDPRARLTCDRLTILLGNRKNRTAAADRDDPLDGMADVSGVSQVIGDGNVRIVRIAPAGETAPDQQAVADRIEYDLAAGRITMTGTAGRQPEIRQDNAVFSGDRILLHRQQERMEALDHCRMVYRDKNAAPGAAPTVLTSDRATMELRANRGEFAGNVRIVDDRMELNCGRMQLTFRSDGRAEPRTVPGVAGTLTPGLGDGARRELEHVLCLDGVRVTRRDGGETGNSNGEERAEAERADLDYRNRKVTLSGGTPTLYRGEDSLSGRELVLYLAEERLTTPSGARIVLCSAVPADPANAAKPPAAAPAGKPAHTVITSDRSDLDYGGNRLTFSGNVEVRDPRLSLDCDKLEIFLADRPGAGSGKAAAPAGAFGLGGNSSGRKTVDRAVCTGRVHATDPQFKLDCDRLGLEFKPAAPGGAPGLFQSGDTRLARVTTDGNVKLVHTPEPENDAKPDRPAADRKLPVAVRTSGPSTLTAERGVADLEKDLTEFHGNVKTVAPEATVTCQSLYLRARNETAGRPADPVAAIDRDPYAGENEVPEKLAIGSGKELRDVTAERDVVISRNLPAGELQRAVGDRAVYDVAGRTITLTGTPDKLPVLEDPKQGRISGEQVRVELDSEKIEVLRRGRLEILNPDVLKAVP